MKRALIKKIVMILFVFVVIGSVVSYFAFNPKEKFTGEVVRVYSDRVLLEVTGGSLLTEARTVFVTVTEDTKIRGRDNDLIAITALEARDLVEVTFNGEANIELDPARIEVCFKITVF